MLKAVEAQSVNTLETVVKIRDLMGEYKERMAKELQKINKAGLIEYLFSQPFYTQRQMANSLNLNKNTVFKYMKLLEEKGFIKVLTNRKENIYFSEKFIEILK
jgi:Fic family protein